MKKVCSSCDVEKPQQDFYSGRNKCKVCYLGNIKKYDIQYRKKNKELLKEKHKQFYIKNKEKINKKNNKYSEENREKLREYAKKYYKENKKMLLDKQSKYRKENQEQLYAYRKNKLKTDPIFALSCRIRTLICISFTNRGYSKNSRSHEILGIGWEGLKEHFERQFVDGMNWENRDRWHIDHIIPLATAQSEDDVIKLNHYTNLQPLWAHDNLSKGSKIL